MMRRLRKSLALLLAALRFQLGADDEAGFRKRKRGISQRYRKPRVKRAPPVPDVGTPKGLSE